MASKPETTFTQSIHRHLPKNFYHVKTHNPYVGGIPDVWYSGVDADLWVEYKFEVLPARDDTVVPITLGALQIDWMQHRYLEGRHVAVIVGCKEGGVIFTDLKWNFPLTKKHFMEKLMNRQQLAAWVMERTGGPLGV